MNDPILLISKPKKKRRELTKEERAAIIEELEKPIDFNVKVTDYQSFEKWLGAKLLEANKKVYKYKTTQCQRASMKISKAYFAYIDMIRDLERQEYKAAWGIKRDLI